MTLKEFKTEAQQRGNYFDNSENAAHEWAKSWGLTWWRLVWFYKEFRVGGMVYRSGMWRGRHGGHTVTECTIDGEAVSKYRFEKALATFTAPEMTAEEKARREAQERNRLSPGANTMSARSDAHKGHARQRPTPGNYA